MSLSSYTVVYTSCSLSSGSSVPLTTNVRRCSAPCFGIFGLNDLTCCCCFFKCPFCASLDSAKYLETFSTVTQDHSTKKHAWIVVSFVAYVGKPLSACKYCSCLAMEGSSCTLLITLLSVDHIRRIVVFLDWFSICLFKVTHHNQLSSCHP